MNWITIKSKEDLPPERIQVIVRGSLGTYDIAFVFNGKWITKAGKITHWRRLDKLNIGREIMAWLAVDRDGTELYFYGKPKRLERKGEWVFNNQDMKDAYVLPKGAIERFLGRKVTWEDEPIEIH